MQQEGGTVYRCNKCGNESNNAVNVYERDGSLSVKCAECGSTDVSPGTEKCSICGRVLYRSERAYEAGGLLICGNCLTEVMIG